MNTDKLFTFDLVVGDDSDDGHGQTEIFKIFCNLSYVELWKAYKEGTKIVGFAIDKFFKSAESNTIKVKHLQRLIELGLTEWDVGEEDGEADIEIYPENYAELWLFTAMLGNPVLQFEHGPRALRLPIGGYGLFFD